MEEPPETDPLPPTEPSPETEVTRLLREAAGGSREAADLLLPRVYAELRRLAGSKMSREKPGQTLQPTALVHEAYLRLVKDDDARWQNRAHFFAAAAEAMRRILIERARRYARLKHGGEQRRVPLDEGLPDATTDPEELLNLDRCLSRLEQRDAQMGQVVKLRYFAGLTIEETAGVLAVSPRQVNRAWTAARAWLRREMQAP